jgi:methylmalonyl-CoA mutase C-terminal domain/subunit
MGEEKIRVLVAKPGLDGHDRGAKVIATAFRDAGFEVIYTGLHQTPEAIVETALQEDVDFICVSILSGAHLPLFGRIMSGLEEKGAAEIEVIGGGVIPQEDLSKLEGMGVRAVFGPGTPTSEPIAYIRERFRRRRHAAPEAD